MYVITIDGPASSGKGTVAKLVARRLGFSHLDSGAIYRALALLTLEHNLKVDEEDRVINLIQDMQLSFSNGGVILNGRDISEKIRDEQVGMLASTLAKNKILREHLLEFQRRFAKEHNLVTDGRDMGSIVFPDATLKVFLTAAAEIRANRRMSQLQMLGKSATISAVLNDIVARDRQDTERKAAPLRYDETYKVLDNSDLTIEETVLQILDWFFAVI